MKNLRFLKLILLTLVAVLMMSLLIACDTVDDDDEHTKTEGKREEKTEEVLESEKEAPDDTDTEDSINEEESSLPIDSETDTELSVTTEQITPEPTATESVVPVETTVPETSGQNVSSDKEVPYLEKVEDPGFDIYSGPGYEYAWADTVRVAGVYTIVEEAYDSAGNLWGKLKSGLGWIDLTKNRGMSSQLLSARRLSNSDRTDRMVILSNGQYAQRIGIESSCDVLFAVYELKYTDSGFEKVFIADGMLKYGQVFCVQLEMHDTTTLAVEAANIDGVKQNYLLCESGKDGSLVFAIQ